MTILVIGATGFIGTELTKIGRAAGHRMIGCGRSAWEGKNKALFPEKEDYWCTAEGCLPAALLQQADCLVLLAAKRPYPGFCFEDYAENVAVAQRYMQLAMENGLKNIVFASSKAVYSGDERPWKEEMFSTPFSLYGASKAAAEHLGLYYSAAGRLCFKSLRFAHVIGAGERRLSHQYIDRQCQRKKASGRFRQRRTETTVCLRQGRCRGYPRCGRKTGDQRRFQYCNARGGIQSGTGGGRQCEF